MDNKPYKQFNVSRPKDRSLEAYKAWIMELAKKITTGRATVKWTEEEWIAHWEKFWKERPNG